VAYGTDLVECWRRLADIVHQILNGTKPEDIPIYQATKFGLAIDLKAAKALGLTIPPLNIARASAPGVTPPCAGRLQPLPPDAANP
jgi:putative tryptophan/tyrosine transport system substrate-binding protein